MADKLFPTYNSPETKEAAKQQAIRQALRKASPASPAGPVSPASLASPVLLPDAVNQIEADEVDTYIPTPDAAEDRDVLRQFEVDVGKTSLDVDKLRQAKSSLDERLQPAVLAQHPALGRYNDEISSISDKISKIQAAKKDEIKQGQIARIVENLGHALTQYASGVYGMKHGVDVSGARFNKTDWAAETRNNLDVLNDEIEGLRAGRQELEKGKEKTERRLVSSAEKDYELELSGEKDRSIAARQLAGQRVQAAVSLRTRQDRENRQILALSERATKEGGKAGLQLVDKEYKALGSKLDGLNQAISTLQGMESGVVDDNTVGQNKIRAGLGKAGLSSEELDEQMKPTGIFSFFQGANKKAGINYLNNLKKQAEEAYLRVDADHEKLYKQATGQDRPESAKFRLSRPAVDAPPAPGDVRDGYEFQGGDPSSKDNWKQVPPQTSAVLKSKTNRG